MLCLPHLPALWNRTSRPLQGVTRPHCQDKPGLARSAVWRAFMRSRAGTSLAVPWDWEVIRPSGLTARFVIAGAIQSQEVAAQPPRRTAHPLHLCTQGSRARARPRPWRRERQLTQREQAAPAEARAQDAALGLDDWCARAAPSALPLALCCWVLTSCPCYALVVALC